MAITPPDSDADAARLAAAVEALPGLDRVRDALAGGPPAYLVGGAVRDLLLGRPTDEFDVVCVGDAPALAAQAAERLDGRVVIHDRFGTATVVAPDLRFDVVTARAESYPRPGALPEVRPAGLEEDLARRDFTINALAMELTGDHPGALHAAPHALEDLEAGRVRVLTERSFHDDPTRLLRLVRYASRLDFTVEEETARLAREAAQARAFDTLSRPRLRDALRHALREPQAAKAIALMEELSIADALHPGLRLDADQARRAEELLPGDGQADLLLFGVWAASLARDEVSAWLGELALDRRVLRTVGSVALDAPGLADALAAARRPSEIVAAARPHPVETVARAGALGAAEGAREYLERLRHVTLDIDGYDVIEAGGPAGPELGRALDRALAAKLDGETDGREAELRVALGAGS